METSTAAQKFLGEWLWIGNLGHALTVIALISAILSTLFYFLDEQNKENNSSGFPWAKRFFQLHVIAIVGIFITLFTIIFYHRYEYHYAWRHSSNALPVHYMISCFWEGQEGSFLLWLFWNSILGLILQRSAKEWESPVMVVVGFAQIALSSMLIGFQFGEFKIGSSPFDLLREQRPDLLNIPILATVGIENYLQVFKDGNGLNPILQNYWMVIHPPTLFLGFATALVPFAYSIAALWRGNERAWLSPALIWSLVCVGILGLGIIMGGFWAYESLSFGGYWAWDPVENASLMPWLIMAAAAHMVVISRSTGRHLFTSHLLIQLSFWLVLYATFLTRSGILGDSSVHSFTDLGLSGQLLLFLLAFLSISLLVIVKPSWRIKLAIFFVSLFLLPVIAAYNLPNDLHDTFTLIIKYLGIAIFLLFIVSYIWMLYQRTKADLPDETLNSREFWMFLGSMFLILSLVQVFAATSIPVFNKLFGSKTVVPPADSYNKIQLWLAMPIMLLMAIAHWFRFKETEISVLKKSLTKIGIAGLIAGIILIFGFGVSGFGFQLFLVISVLLIVANAWYLIEKKGIEWRKWGGSLAHVGFGVLLLGVLISSVNKNVLTGSEAGIDLAPEIDENGKIDEKGVKFNRQNQILYKNQFQSIKDYDVKYIREIKGSGNDSIDKYFTVAFIKRDKNGNIIDSFSVNPKTQNNPKMGMLAEPSTKHFLHKDIFTHVNYESGMDRKEPFASFKTDTVSFREVFTSSTGKLQFSIDTMDKAIQSNGLLIRLAVKAKRLNDSAWLHPTFGISSDMSSFQSKEDNNESLGALVSIVNLQIMDPNPSNPGAVKFVVTTAEKTPVKHYIVLQVIEFPWINLVWGGTIIMVLGFALSVSNRISQYRKLMNA